MVVYTTEELGGWVLGRVLHMVVVAGMRLGLVLDVFTHVSRAREEEDGGGKKGKDLAS